MADFSQPALNTPLDTVLKEKAVYTVLQLRTVQKGQTAIKNGTSHRSTLRSWTWWLQSDGQDLSHTQSCASSLYNIECPSEGLTRNLCKARNSLKDKRQSWHMPMLAPSILLQPWIQSYIARVTLQNKDTYCLREEVPVVGSLIHFLLVLEW